MAGVDTKMKPRDTPTKQAQSDQIPVHYGLGDLGHDTSPCWASVSHTVKWGSTSSSLTGLLTGLGDIIGMKG